MYTIIIIINIIVYIDIVMLCILFANITYGCNCMAVVSEASQLCVYVQCEALHYKLVAIEPQNGMECEHMMLGVDIDSDWHTFSVYADARSHNITSDVDKLLL